VFAGVAADAGATHNPMAVSTADNTPSNRHLWCGVMGRDTGSPSETDQRILWVSETGKSADDCAHIAYVASLYPY
jgi:hypothetical protein